ncbi:MAG: formyltransferase family protein [Ignavibacteria bacterium]|nr:formyltransferase family protein [Ignavibacteria bacterium]
MVQGLKYFYLTDGILGFICLKGLIEKKLIPELVITHKKYQNLNIEELSKKEKIPILIIENLKNHNINLGNFHLGICVGFMEILKEDVFNAPQLGIFNLHCGKLPDYRGRAPISRALINGDNKITMTIHKIDSGVDSGPILIEKEFSVSNEDDAKTVYDKCTLYSADLIEKAFRIIRQNNFISHPENISKILKPQIEITKPANKAITKTERIINWEKSANEIYNLIRALVPPYPSAITYYKSEEILITKANIIENESYNKNPGIIEKVENMEIEVLCRKGRLKIYEIIYNDKITNNFLQIFKTGDILK